MAVKQASELKLYEVAVISGTLAAPFVTVVVVIADSVGGAGFAAAAKAGIQASEVLDVRVRSFCHDGKLC